MSLQRWQEPLFWATADGAAIASSTTETIIFPDVTIPANYMQDGRWLRVVAKGRWSNVVTAVPTLTFRIRWGGVAGVVLVASGAVVTPAAATTNAIWGVEAFIQTRLNGSAGTIFAMGELSMFEDAVPTFGTVGNYGVISPMGSAGVATPAAATVDLTTDKALSITAQWSASNAANSVTGHLCMIDSGN